MIKTYIIGIALVLSFASNASANRNNQDSVRAKYVFLFIGDGMGLAHIALAEAYLANSTGKIGIDNLSMTGFPSQGFCNTYCNNNQTTCSAASGTALSTGIKTNFGVIAKTPDLSMNLTSIAYDIKKAGYKIGIITTVSLNHATPAAFYAHSDKRSDYYNIGEQLCKSNFDFFAGGGFHYSKGRNGQSPDLYEIALQNGYNIVRDSVDTKHFNRKGKTILLNPVSLSEAEMPLAIDRAKLGGYKLSNMTEAAIDNLYNETGFFIMIEGGLIDWAAHYNDAAAIVHEVLDFDDAIKVALDFYEKHPDETLIVVTADHETGGLSLGRSEPEYDTDFAKLSNEINSAAFIAPFITKLIADSSSFGTILTFLAKDFFASEIILDSKELLMLQQAYEYSSGHIFLDKETEHVLYGGNQPVAAAAVQIINKRAGVGFSSYYHTSIPVPVFSIGSQSDKFDRYLDNTDIPILIMECMKLNRTN